MCEKLKFEDDCCHDFDYTGYAVGHTYTCFACGTQASTPGGEQTLCPAKLRQKLVDIRDMVKSSPLLLGDHVTMAALENMFGLGS